MEQLGHGAEPGQSRVHLLTPDIQGWFRTHFGGAITGGVEPSLDFNSFLGSKSGALPELAEPKPDADLSASPKLERRRHGAAWLLNRVSAQSTRYFTDLCVCVNVPR